MAFLLKLDSFSTLNVWNGKWFTWSWRTNRFLTLCVLCISECCIKKIYLTFLLSIFFVVPQKVLRRPFSRISRGKVNYRMVALMRMKIPQKAMERRSRVNHLNKLWKEAVINNFEISRTILATYNIQIY